MGTNINKPDGRTFFIDLDGVLVKHNYDPENIPDQVIMSTLLWLKRTVKPTDTVFITTSRNTEHAWLAIDKLVEEGFNNIGINLLADLPTGKRIVINDYKEQNDYPKAIAFNVLRDIGFSEEDKCIRHQRSLL